MTIPIGPLQIRVYGLLIILGMLAGTWLATRLAPRYGLRGDWIWDFVPWGALTGLIGARMWHVFFPSVSAVHVGTTREHYFKQPLEIIAIWKGGLGMPGVILGGLVGLVLYLYFRKQLPLWTRYLDVAAPGLALAQAIGRWGNYFNQELYGKPTNLPWAIYIDPAHRIPGYENVAYYHPLFLYESLLNLVNLGILLYLEFKHKHRLRHGDLFLVYLINYGLIRFFLEFLRLDAAFVDTININQAVMAGVVVLSVLMLAWRHRWGLSTGTTDMEALSKRPRHAKPKRRKGKK